MNLKKATAGQLMTTHVLTIDAHETLRAAALMLHKHHIHCLIVPPPEPQLSVGVITVKDIVQVLCDGDAPMLDQLLVQDAMTTPSVSVQKDFTIGDCLKLMRLSGVRSAPVLDGVKLVGLLSFTDVLRVVAHEPLPILVREEPSS